MRQRVEERAKNKRECAGAKPVEVLWRFVCAAQLKDSACLVNSARRSAEHDHRISGAELRGSACEVIHEGASDRWGRGRGNGATRGKKDAKGQGFWVLGGLGPKV